MLLSDVLVAAGVLLYSSNCLKQEQPTLLSSAVSSTSHLVRLPRKVGKDFVITSVPRQNEGKKMKTV